jgi:RNA polymerase sigma-B factor
MLKHRAERVGAGEEQVLDALQAAGAYRAASLHASRPTEDEEEGATVADALGDEDRGFGLAEDRATLDRLLRTLAPREREVLRLRFDEDLTQAEIGERIGVSQMQISRLIRQSLGRLRAAAGE